jgi:N4-gp56 family major capsid protein
MATTSVAQITAAITNQIRTQLLTNLRARLILAQFAQEGMVDKGHNVIRFLQVPDLGASSTTLADDGVNPTAEALSLTTFDLTPSEIGRVVSVTRRATNISPFEIVSKAANILAFDAQRRIDTIVWTAGVAAGTVRYSGSAASRVTTSANMVGADVRKISVKLKSLNAMPWGAGGQSMSSGGPSGGTSGGPGTGGGDWMAVTHPFVTGDLLSETVSGSWLDTSKYAQPGNIYNGEAGKLYGVRFMESTNATIFAAAGAGSVDVYTALVFGQEALGVGSIQNVTPTYVPATPDHADALGRTALVGYYMDTGAVALQNASYVRFETAATAL